MCLTLKGVQQDLASTEDPYDLARFVSAQQAVHEQALQEIRAGRKRTHWMWFVFPQLRGLGSSPMAHRYGISGLDEARAYVAHPLLGPRLRECCGAVLEAVADPMSLFGTPDHLKLKSSATLFALAATPPSVFGRVIQEKFGGVPDAATLGRLDIPWPQAPVES